MKKIVILFFVPQLVGGGAEKVNMNIMKLLDKKIFEVHLVVASLNASVYKSLPEDVIFHNLESSKTMFSILKLRNIVVSIKPDILFSSLIRGNIASMLALFGIRKKPYIIFRSPNSPKLLLENKQVGNIQKKLLEYSYRKADHVIAQTPEMKDELHIYHGIDEKKISVVLNPIDSENINQNIHNIKNPFDKKSINVVAAGRVTYQKGFDILIKSFQNVVKENKFYKLHIIGQGEGVELSTLKKLVNDLNLEEHVFFLGYQSNPYKYFYFSDLYVLSSRWEGLPNTILENLYLKKPIISTTCIPYISSLVQDGQNGFLVDVEDINGLSKAILNYKNLSLKFSKFSDPKIEINNFFKKRKVENV